MGSLDRQRWDALWQRLGGNPPADAFDALLAAYGGADRHYHSDRHILACLEHFDRWRQLALRPDLVELALWTHDLVYDTQRQDNEAASAASTEHWLDQAGLAALRPALRELIMATCHQAPPGDADAALVVDIDLAILAAPAPVYARYEADVRAEYAWVPEPLFRAGRGSCCASCWSNRRCTTANRCGNAGRPPPAPTCAVPWSAWNSRPEPHGKISSRRLTRLSPRLRLRQQEGTARTGSSPLHPPKEEIS